LQDLRERVFAEADAGDGGRDRHAAARQRVLRVEGSEPTAPRRDSNFVRVAPDPVAEHLVARLRTEELKGTGGRGALS